MSEFSAAKFATAKWNDGSASELHIYDVAAISENMAFKVGNGPIVVDPNAGSGGMSAGGGGTGGVGIGGSAGTASSAAGAGAGNGTAGAGTAGTGGGVNLAGAGPAGAATAGAPGSGGSVQNAPAADDGSCACRSVGAPRGSWGASAGALLALVGLLAHRRRRSRRA